MHQIVVVMFVVTLLAPIMVNVHGGSGGSEGWEVDYSVIAMTWIYLSPSFDENSGAFGVWGGGFHVLNLSAMLNTSFLWIFNALFAILVVRHYQRKTSLRSTIVPGLLSLVLPFIQAIGMYFMFIQRTGLLIYNGPVPIQLAVGLFILYYTQSELDKDIWTD